MEDLKVSKDYKKAYNQADIICTYMPHLLDGIHVPEDEPTEYTKGFQDRVRQYEKERDLIKGLSNNIPRNKEINQRLPGSKGMDRD